ncbi:MAG: universal stress protein [Balneolaceae bacterium]|nr:universal stress protein [Balneolaceae bacterium]
MIKRILVALDPDIDTQIAKKHAIELAKTHEAALSGLAVVNLEHIESEVGTGGIGTIYYAQQLREHMAEQSRKTAGRLLDEFEMSVRHAGVKFTEKMEEGVPYQRIIEDMKYHDLLVVGRTPHFFYNRPEKETVKTLAKVVKNGISPTLIVTEAYREVNRVTVAYDGSPASARTLQWFVHLLPYGMNLSIELVTVPDGDNEKNMDQATLLMRLAGEYLKAHGFDSFGTTVLEIGDPGEKILSHLKESGSDLILLGAHSMSAIKRIAFGSVTHHLVTKSPVPLFLSH